MELNNLKTESTKLRMTPAEKAAMKASVFGVASPMPAAQPSSYFAFSFQFLHARVLVPALAVVLVFGGASTTAAAQGALPGDLLYPVKISVNEAIKVALATTPVAKAEVSAELAVRRVEEAEVLASQGLLTPEAGEEIAANFEEHAEKVAALTTELEVNDPDEALNVRAKLDSSLLAHGAILATLTEGGAKDNQEGTGVVAARVLARTIASPRPEYAPANLAMRSKVVAPEAQNMTMSLMVATDASTSTAGSEVTGTVSLEGDTIDGRPAGDEGAAKRAQARAEVAFAEARGLFESGKSKLTSAMITQVSGEFASIEAQTQLGSTTLNSGHFDEALSDYTEALNRATKLYVLLKAQASIKMNIITPILENIPAIDESIKANILPAAN